MRRIVILACVLIAIAAFFSAVVAEEAAKPAATHDYVGADKCKICHKDVFTSWSTSPHAKAWDVLSAEEQKKPECITCHMTGQTKGEKPEMLTGVQCEACHGPGSDYKSPTIKSKTKWAADAAAQRKLAQDAGLNSKPSVADCTRCHKKEGNPNFKEFDYEKRKVLVHPVKVETKTEG